MVIMYDNFDLMKEPPNYVSVNNMDLATLNYTPNDNNFIIPVEVKEVIKFTIYEGGKAIKMGNVIGNTFTTTGKTQLATLVGRTDGLPITAVICTVNGTDYSQGVTNTTPGDSSTLRVTSGTFTTSGTYTVVAGANGTTKYNTISTSIVVGVSQSVQYVIDYVFSGSVGTTFYKVCAARLGNVAGSYNAPLGTIKVTTTDFVTLTSPSTGVVTSNTLTVSNTTGFTSTGKTFNVYSFNMSSVDTAVYTGTGMTIPLASSQTLNVRGVFVFG